MSSLIRVSPFLISFAVTCVFFINLCAAIFQCGCRSLWAGSDMACNIHMQHSRHCPWCSHGVAGQALVMVLLCVPQLAVAIGTRWSWPVRTLVATMLFPLLGLAVAYVFGLADGYWKP